MHTRLRRDNIEHLLIWRFDESAGTRTWRIPMEAIMMDGARELGDELEETTVGSVYESIETNLWQADGYFAQGASGLAIECLRSAWSEYVRFRDIIYVYDSAAGGGLGDRLVRALVGRAGASSAALALGDVPESRPVWESLIAA